MWGVQHCTPHTASFSKLQRKGVPACSEFTSAAQTCIVPPAGDGTAARLLEEAGKATAENCEAVHCRRASE